MGNRRFTINATTLALLVSKDARIAENYTFKADGRTLTINEPDYKRMLLVVNLTTENLLYNPLKQPEPKLEGNKITFNYEDGDMTDTDDLLVVYEAIKDMSIQMALAAVIDQLEQQTKLLYKIYN